MKQFYCNQNCFNSVVLRLCSHGHFTWIILCVSVGLITTLSTNRFFQKIERIADTNHLRGYYIIQLEGSNRKGGRGPRLDERVTHHKWRIWNWASWDDVISQPAPDQLLHQSNWRSWTLYNYTIWRVQVRQLDWCSFVNVLIVYYLLLLLLLF